jgi:dTDP-4-amino-4,6-dideoxygalactose transaminase
MIPHMDLQAQLSILMPELLQKTEEIFSSRSYIHGSYVTKFEQQFAELQGAAFCSGCSNGTSALFLALTACGIGHGDEVITTPHTFIATAEAISHTGATPVFVDIIPTTYTIDPVLVERAITPRTRAIVPVHLYGCPADMDQLTSIAKKNNLLIIEDCAQAHLASYRGQPVGTFGAAGSFSFYPGKNLGAYGDAGAVISNDGALVTLVRKLLNHGRSEKYLHEIIGYNHRMDELQAGLLQIKLRYLEQWTARRQKLAACYSRMLQGGPHIRIPVVPDDVRHVFHLYVVEVPERTRVAAALKNQGVQTGIHYPVPLHLQPAYRCLGYQPGDFPVTEQAADRVLSLPLFPELQEEDVQTVCRYLVEIVNNLADRGAST